jgi:hypothetical protein
MQTETADLCSGASAVDSADEENETWTMDFLQDALAPGCKVCTLSIEDAFTREMLAIAGAAGDQSAGEASA